MHGPDDPQCVEKRHDLEVRTYEINLAIRKAEKRKKDLSARSSVAAMYMSSRVTEPNIEAEDEDIDDSIRGVGS